MVCSNGDCYDGVCSVGVGMGLQSEKRGYHYPESLPKMGNFPRSFPPNFLRFSTTAFGEKQLWCSDMEGEVGFPVFGEVLRVLGEWNSYFLF